VVEYAPHNGIDDLIWLQKTGTEPEIPAKTVVEFPKKEV